MTKEKILVVEDDRPILTGLVDLLRGEGFEVEAAEDGKKALLAYGRCRPNLVLLDIMIPEKSGYDVCREIRAKDRLTPILMLTAKSQEVDKVVGLELGADDYVVKPFGVSELLARVRALLRRGRREETVEDKSPIAFGDIRIDPRTHEGTKAGRPVAFTAKEIKLLQYFLRREGEVVERFDVLEAVWGMRYEGTTRTLDQHIAKLRQKVEDDPAEPKHILTVHGAGYKFRRHP